MTADALIPCVARPSAAVILTAEDKWVIVFYNEEGFQWPVHSKGWEIIHSYVF